MQRSYGKIDSKEYAPHSPEAWACRRDLMEFVLAAEYATSNGTVCNLIDITCNAEELYDYELMGKCETRMKLEAEPFGSTGFDRRR